MFLKIHFPKRRQNPEKIPVKEFTFTEVSGLRPATRLKMNSATSIFKDFSTVKIYFSLNFQIYEQPFPGSILGWLLPVSIAHDEHDTKRIPKRQCKTQKLKKTLKT